MADVAGDKGIYLVENGQLFCGLIITYDEAMKPMVYLNTVPKTQEEVMMTLAKYVTIESVQFKNVPIEVQKWAKQVIDVFRGNDQDTSAIPIDLSGYTPKQRVVVEVSHQQLEPGKYYSYGEVAALAGIPNAHRFVGTTMKTLRQPYIVPVQRVKRSDWIKKRLRQKKPKKRPTPL